MKLRKRMLVVVSILAAFVALTRVDLSFAQSGGSDKPAVSPKRGPYLVVGSLQSRDKVVTISQGPKGIVYTIQTKDGKTVARRLKEKDLQAKYPGIYNQIKSGIAGNDATLRSKTGISR